MRVPFRLAEIARLYIALYIKPATENDSPTNITPDWSLYHGELDPT